MQFVIIERKFYNSRADNPQDWKVVIDFYALRICVPKINKKISHNSAIDFAV
jgi:hypothetical protein